MVAVEPNLRILALDPGGTTGWATYSCLIIPGMEFSIVSLTEKFACGHITGPKHHRDLVGLLELQRVATFVVVCESFNDTASGHSVDLMAKEYIGTVETWCQENEIQLFMQMPGVAKPFVKNANLRRLGLWQGVKWKHAMDAYRHLMWHLIFKANRTDFLAKGWPNE